MLDRCNGISAIILKCYAEELKEHIRWWFTIDFFICCSWPGYTEKLPIRVVGYVGIPKQYTYLSYVSKTSCGILY